MWSASSSRSRSTAAMSSMRRSCASRSMPRLAVGESGEAVGLFQRAFNAGLAYGIWIHRDIDLESLRDYPPFQELMRPKW